MQARLRFVFGLAALAAFALLAGCDSGAQMGQVSGTVTLDGEPAPSLEVSFEPKDPSLGTTAMGYTQDDGSYQLHYPGSQTGAPVGEYSVSISPAETDAQTPPPSIPPKYNTETELSFTVEPGENTANFDLEK
ncbi:MAG: hypothetical protein ACODAD_12960 [Planctomycetota bacterium]